MFRTIVLAILFVELWIPLILWLLWAIDSEDTIWCWILAIVFIVIIAILL